MSIIDITHLYNIEKENPIYMLIDLKNGQEMTIHNKESLAVYLQYLTPRDKPLIGYDGWICLDPTDIMSVNTLDDVFEICDMIKRSDMIPNKRYPTDFLNMDMDLHIRRIL